MRLIDGDELLKCIPVEELVSRMAVANAPTIEPKTGKLIDYHGRMTLDEAIQYCEEVAKDEEFSGYIVNKKFGEITTYGEEYHKRAMVNLQLAEWLKELRLYHRMRGDNNEVN